MMLTSHLLAEFLLDASHVKIVQVKHQAIHHQDGSTCKSHCLLRIILQAWQLGWTSLSACESALLVDITIHRISHLKGDRL